MKTKPNTMTLLAAIAALFTLFLPSCAEFEELKTIKAKPAFYRPVPHDTEGALYGALLDTPRYYVKSSLADSGATFGILIHKESPEPDELETELRVSYWRPVDEGTRGAVHGSLVPIPPSQE